MPGVVERLDGVEQTNPSSTAMLEGAMKGRGFWSCPEQFFGHLERKERSDGAEVHPKGKHSGTGTLALEPIAWMLPSHGVG